MRCYKYKLINNSSKIYYFSYRRCCDLITFPQEPLLPRQTKTIRVYGNTFRTPYTNIPFRVINYGQSNTPCGPFTRPRPTPTPTPTRTPTPTPTRTPRPTPTRTPTPTPTRTPIPTPTKTPTPTPTRTPTPTPTRTPTPTPTKTPTPTPTLGPVVQCLQSLNFIIEYNESPLNGSPCAGGHVCNRAVFDVIGNTTLIQQISLNNAGGPFDLVNRPPNYPNYSGANVLDRYVSFGINQQQAIEIAETSPTGEITIQFVCACVSGVTCNVGPNNCHQNVSWMRVYKDNVIIYNGCPEGNVLTFSPCILVTQTPVPTATSTPAPTPL